MPGPVESQLRRDITRRGTICLALIDSEGIGEEKAVELTTVAERCGISGILVGGSTAVDQLELDRIIRAVKAVTKIPVILFPGNVTGISPGADAILFSSLLNSDNPYFISQAQALGALLVRKYQIEAIPTGYIVVGEGGSIGFVGRARGIPTGKPMLAAMHALAAQYMGMRFVYLESGSGVTSQVTPEMIEYVRKSFAGVLMVGGGIRRPDRAKRYADAGADIIVVGNLLETPGFERSLRAIIHSISRSRRDVT